MNDAASRTSEMKVLSLDAAFSRCDELERNVRKVNGVRLAMPASFSAVLAAGGWLITFGAPVPPARAEWTWFSVFFGLYGLVALLTELRLRRRAKAMSHELVELRRWTRG